MLILLVPTKLRIGANYSQIKAVYNPEGRRPARGMAGSGLPPLILGSLSPSEEIRMRGVAVKCIDITQNTDCEGRSLRRN